MSCRQRVYFVSCRQEDRHTHTQPLSSVFLTKQTALLFFLQVFRPLSFVCWSCYFSSFSSVFFSTKNPGKFEAPLSPFPDGRCVRLVVVTKEDDDRKYHRHNKITRKSKSREQKKMNSREYHQKGICRNLFGVSFFFFLVFFFSTSIEFYSSGGVRPRGGIRWVKLDREREREKKKIREAPKNRPTNQQRG